MFERLVHWITKSRKKSCKHCCIGCEYYNECKFDEK